MRDPIGCSLGFVTLPIKVSALSLIRAEVSRSGALILLGAVAYVLGAILLPFSSAVNLR